MAHPLFDQPMPTETGPAPYPHIPRAELRPAPMPGEHTRDICQKLLGLDPEEIDRLIADGVLFTAYRPKKAEARFMPSTPGRRCWSATARSTSATKIPASNRRPDGGGRARGRRPAGAGGGRRGARRQPAVVALPRSGTAARAASSAPRTPPPATPGSAAMCRRRWSTRRAWTSRQAARRRADRRRGNLAHPNATARSGTKPRLDEAGRVGAVAPRRRRRRADGRAGELTHRPGPARLRLSAVRAGGADRRGGVAGRSPQPHRRTVVAVQRCGRTTRTPGAVNRCRPSRSGNPAPTTG